jgi:hypothetical protein
MALLEALFLGYENCKSEPSILNIQMFPFSFLQWGNLLKALEPVRNVANPIVCAVMSTAQLQLLDGICRVPAGHQCCIAHNRVGRHYYVMRCDMRTRSRPILMSESVVRCWHCELSEIFLLPPASAPPASVSSCLDGVLPRLPSCSSANGISRGFCACYAPLSLLRWLWGVRGEVFLTTLFIFFVIQWATIGSLSVFELLPIQFFALHSCLHFCGPFLDVNFSYNVYPDVWKFLLSVGPSARIYSSGSRILVTPCTVRLGTLK